MHVENIKSTQTVYKNSIVNTEYTTVVDDKTHKQYTEVTTHEIRLYTRTGTDLHWTNKHNINLYI
jgi:hypothetical protein